MVPEPGEWWTHKRNHLYGLTFGSYGSYPVSFYIEDVVFKDVLADSWVIYSNNDNSGDYFVAQMWEFIQGDWEKN